MSLLAQKYPWSKWRKHVALCNEQEIAAHLPETAVLNHDNLHTFLRNHPVVYAKPSCGGGGKGVLKLMRCNDTVHIMTTTERYHVPLASAFAKVKALSGKRSYIVQQGIDLIKIEGRPIDFRTLLLRPKTEWDYMGIMGKLAVKEQIVTNHCRGGSSISFAQAIAQSKGLADEETGELEKRVEGLSLSIAQALHRKFPMIAELGLDIGIDECLNMWLIEANTRPQYNLFKDHADLALYKRIDGIIRSVRLPLR
ncbi:MAG: hypothetical protein K0R57_5881 [Paenibacillaceae bacterium]|nr:hypothetical protein [Paenibacillaceae bacterium]